MDVAWKETLVWDLVTTQERVDGKELSFGHLVDLLSLCCPPQLAVCKLPFLQLCCTGTKMDPHPLMSAFT